MIVYKLDKPTYASANSQIKDMHRVLSEIAPSLEILSRLLKEHANSISTPTIDNYRANLQQTVDNAVQINKIIAESAQKLCAISDQMSNQLSVIDQTLENPSPNEYASQPSVAERQPAVHV